MKRNILSITWVPRYQKRIDIVYINENEGLQILHRPLEGAGVEDLFYTGTLFYPGAGTGRGRLILGGRGSPKPAFMNSRFGLKSNKGCAPISYWQSIS